MLAQQLTALVIGELEVAKLADRAAAKNMPIEQSLAVGHLFTLAIPFRYRDPFSPSLSSFELSESRIQSLPPLPGPSLVGSSETKNRTSDTNNPNTHPLTSTKPATMNKSALAVNRDVLSKATRKPNDVKTKPAIPSPSEKPAIKSGIRFPCPPDEVNFCRTSCSAFDD